MEIFGLATLIALGVKIVSFLKFIRAGWTDDAFTQVVTWMVGVVLVFLAAEANLIQNFELYGISLAEANVASKILIGMSLLSLGSFAYDVKKARDNSDTAREPNLLTGAVTSHGK